MATTASRIGRNALYIAHLVALLDRIFILVMMLVAFYIPDQLEEGSALAHSSVENFSLEIAK